MSCAAGAGDFMNQVAPTSVSHSRLIMGSCTCSETSPCISMTSPPILAVTDPVPRTGISVPLAALMRCVVRRILLGSTSDAGSTVTSHPESRRHFHSRPRIRTGRYAHRPLPLVVCELRTCAGGFGCGACCAGACSVRRYGQSLARCPYSLQSKHAPGAAL